MSRANKDKWVDISGKREERWNIITARGPAVGNILQHNMHHNLVQRLYLQTLQFYSTLKCC